jgi:CHASE3 domain sensor protein
LFLPFVMITVILSGITVYYLWKLKKSNWIIPMLLRL